MENNCIFPLHSLCKIFSFISAEKKHYFALVPVIFLQPYKKAKVPPNIEPVQYCKITYNYILNKTGQLSYVAYNYFYFSEGCKLN